MKLRSTFRTVFAALATLALFRTGYAYEEEAEAEAEQEAEAEAESAAASSQAIEGSTSLSTTLESTLTKAIEARAKEIFNEKNGTTTLAACQKEAETELLAKQKSEADNKDIKLWNAYKDESISQETFDILVQLNWTQLQAFKLMTAASIAKAGILSEDQLHTIQALSLGLKRSLGLAATDEIQDNSSVTQVEAEQRSAMIASGLNYQIHADLTQDDCYAMQVSIQFTIQKPEMLKTTPLNLNFFGGDVLALSINGTPILNPDDYAANGRILLNAEYLTSGTNTVTVRTQSPYNESFRKFVDPADERVYIYSNLEPADAHGMFPCFDQPDLRASFYVTVEAPATWTVLSNGEQIGTAKQNGYFATWTFQPEPNISTYLFNITAGDWLVYKDYWAINGKNINFRALARHELGNFTEPLAKRWMLATSELLNAFSEKFGLPFPYQKVDQIICPNYPQGGMENPGAITYSEFDLIYDPSQADEAWLNLMIVTAHEIAHMWWGDLVTVKWWNDLPLKESFANYFESAILADLKDKLLIDLEPSVVRAMTKTRRAMLADNNPEATHPLFTDVPSTSKEDTVYDSITYPKGGCTLAQLGSMMDSHNFIVGLNNYLKKNQGKGATRADFYAAFTSYMLPEKRDMLEIWKKQWLEQAGCNTVSAFLTSGPDGKLASFTLEQEEDPISHITRMHAMDVAFFRLDDDTLTRIGVYPVNYDGKTTTLATLGDKALNKLTTPDFVLLNYNNKDYVFAPLDAKSFATLQKVKLSTITDAPTRAAIILGLTDALRAGTVAPKAIFAYLQDNILSEKDATIFDFGLKTANDALYKGMSSEDRAPYLKKWSESLWAAYENLDTGRSAYQVNLVGTKRLSVMQILAGSPIGVATTASAQNLIQALFSNFVSSAGSTGDIGAFTLNNEAALATIKKNALTNLAKADYPLIATLIYNVSKNYPDWKVNSILGAIPSKGNYATYWSIIQEPNTKKALPGELTLATRFDMMLSFFPNDTANRDYIPKLIPSLMASIKAGTKASSPYVTNYITAFLPGKYSAEFVKQLEDLKALLIEKKASEKVQNLLERILMEARIWTKARSLNKS